MTDTDKLKRLAEAIAKRPRPSVDYTLYEGYYCAADPTTILALIAENERLKVDKGNMQAVFNDTVGECDKLSTERDEAVALLREWDKIEVDGVVGTVIECETYNFLARIDAKEPK